MRIGIECGGTFTDVVVLDDDGRLVATDKLFSTPDSPATAVAQALDRMSAQVRDGATLLHGSTVATNALIERKGAWVGLVTTLGFRDVVFLQRQDRTRMYDLTIQSPRPIVDRELVVEVVERLDGHGRVTTPLDEASVDEAVRRLLDLGVDAIAVSLLHSYANPAHEERIRARIHALSPTMPVALSSVSAREFREYERTTTTTVDAFLRPRISSYLQALESHAGDAGVRELSVMQSNGGMVPARVAADSPLSMLRSGPAAGVAGALAVAEQVGLRNIITMDMGGTSTDVAVVIDGRAEQTAETVADGLPLRVPMIDITAVGAGGGSLVTVDGGGLLTVGPQSAGSEPGPVAYGRGGTRPTVTDANVVRGLIRAETFLGGTHPLDSAAARVSFDAVAQTVGRPVEQVVEDVFELASVNMAAAIRLTTTERGFDVEEFTLVAYGGAGPLHAASVADQLQVSRVLIPPHNGLASAYGLLTAGFRREYSRTRLMDAGDLPATTLATLRDEIISGAHDQLVAQGIDLEDAVWESTVEMRYRGQGFEVAVDLGDARVEPLVARFHAAHARRFGHAEPDRDVQVVTMRVAVAKPRPVATLPRLAIDGDLPVHQRPILERGREVMATFVNRQGLVPGIALHGPAVVEDTTSTTFVPTGWVACADDYTNLILERSTDR